MIDKLEEDGQRTLTGHDAFQLYDTYGFPLDLTREILAEQGFEVDEAGFQAEMDAQRERARSARLSDTPMESWDYQDELFADVCSEFIGYDSLSTNEAYIQALVVDGLPVTEAGAGMLQVVLDRTPFYAQGGGHGRWRHYTNSSGRLSGDK